MNAMARNWWTTSVGIIAGASAYLTQTGAKMPSNGTEWASFVFGLALAVLGYVAKDAMTGSKPGE